MRSRFDCPDCGGSEFYIFSEERLADDEPTEAVVICSGCGADFEWKMRAQATVRGSSILRTDKAVAGAENEPGDVVSAEEEPVTAWDGKPPAPWDLICKATGKPKASQAPKEPVTEERWEDARGRVWPNEAAARFASRQYGSTYAVQIEEIAASRTSRS